MANRAEAAEILREHQRAMADARRLMRESRQYWDEVRAGVDGIKSGLQVQAALLRRAASMPAWSDWSPPRRATDAAAEARCDPAAANTFAAVDRLVLQAEAAALSNAESLDGLIRQIKVLILENSEPGMLAGVLLEGIAQTISRLVTETDRPDFVAAALAVLQDRVEAAERARP